MDQPDRGLGLTRSDRRLDRPASVPIRPLRLALILTAAVAILLAAGSTIALASTALVLEPSTATTGTKVTVFNACYLVTDHPPAKLKMAFLDASKPDLTPTNASVPRTTALRLLAPYTYRFVVPRIPAGVYTIALQCTPGNWQANGAEGASLPLTVIAGPPATSTVSTAPDEGRTIPAAPTLLAIAVGLLGGMATWRRTRSRG